MDNAYLIKNFVDEEMHKVGLGNIVEVVGMVDRKSFISDCLAIGPNVLSSKYMSPSPQSEQQSCSGAVFLSAYKAVRGFSAIIESINISNNLSERSSSMLLDSVLAFN